MIVMRRSMRRIVSWMWELGCFVYLVAYTELHYIMNMNMDYKRSKSMK